MIAAVKTAAITALRTDATIKTLLGGEHVYPGHFSGTQQIPGLYVTGSERSATLPGYKETGRRRCDPELLVNLFHDGTVLQADTLADAVDPVLFGGAVPKTGGWKLESRTEQFEEDTRLHHRTLRYSFTYTVED